MKPLGKFLSMQEIWDERDRIKRLDRENKGWRAVNHNVKNTVAEYTFFWREIAKHQGELGLKGAVEAAEKRFQTEFKGIPSRMQKALEKEHAGTKKTGERGRLNALLDAI